MKSAKYIISVLVLAIGFVVAVRAAPAVGVSVRDCWSRATPPGVEVGVAYLVIDNRGRPDQLLAASSPVAKRAELHITEMKNGIVNMRHLHSVDIKPGTPTIFAPGGRHIMLIGLKHPLKKGDTFPLTLRFKNAGPVRVTVPVLDIGETLPQRH